MKYMLLIHSNHEAWDALTPSEMAALQEAHQRIQAETRASGELVDTSELAVTDARVVRVTGGRRVVTDGPFTEAKEFVGGYYVFDCADRDRAVDLAARFHEASFTPIEVRRMGADD